MRPLLRPRPETRNPPNLSPPQNPRSQCAHPCSPSRRQPVAAATAGRTGRRVEMRPSSSGGEGRLEAAFAGGAPRRRRSPSHGGREASQASRRADRKTRQGASQAPWRLPGAPFPSCGRKKGDGRRPRPAKNSGGGALAKPSPPGERDKHTAVNSPLTMHRANFAGRGEALKMRFETCPLCAETQALRPGERIRVLFN